MTQRERLTYGDGGSPDQPEAERAAARAGNRLQRLWRHYDEAGLVVVDRYDVAGRALNQARWTIADPVLAAADDAGGWTPNWGRPNADLDLEPDAHVTSAVYDALGRLVEFTAPADVAGHRAVFQPRYARSGAMQAVVVDGIARIRLMPDARGRRVLTVLDNGLMTRCGYDPLSARLVRLRTEAFARAGDTWTGTGPPLQDLTYSYDLVGNIVSVDERTAGCGVAGTAQGRDRLLRTFTYDPFSRLISATGRACSAVPMPRPPSDDARCASYPAPYAPVVSQVNAPDLAEGYREAYTSTPPATCSPCTTGPPPVARRRVASPLRAG